MKAFVLQRWPYAETDLLVEFYLEDSNIKKAFAAGAKRSKRRFSHQFHSAGLYEIEVKDQRLQRCDLIEYFENISEYLEVWSRWLCVLEWIRVDDAASVSFQELLTLATNLNRLENSRAYFTHFFIQQLERHGLMPSLENCQHCDKSLGAGELHFSFSESGFCHPRCREGVFYSPQAFQAFQGLVRGEAPLEAGAEIWESLEASIIPFLEFQLGKKLKSFHFLRRIQESGQKSQEKSWQNLSSPMF